MQKPLSAIGILVVMMLSFLAIPAVAPIFVNSPVASAATAASSPYSSCTASNPIKVIISGGTPDILGDMVDTGSHTGAIINQMDYYGIQPIPVPLGELYNMSIIDWYSTNNNYTQWTVNIKPGLTWSNGTAVTSDDILATYSDSFGLNPTVDVNNLHTIIKSIVKVNSSAVQFNLNSPNAQFLGLAGAALYATVVPSAYANLNFTGYNINETVIGPYYPYKDTPGSTELTMYRNPYFYTTGIPEPQACELDVSFVEATSGVENAMLSGQYDLGYEIDPGQVPAILQNPNLHVFVQKAAAIQSINWNATVYPFNMTQFRQALAYSTDSNSMVQQALSGYGTPGNIAEGTIDSATPSYNPNQIQYNYNLTTAVSLLSSINVKQDTNGVMRYPNGTAVTLTMLADSSFTPDLVEASILATDLKQIGITLSVQTESHSAFSHVKSMSAGTMYLTQSSGVDFPYPFIAASPACAVYAHPHICVSKTVNGLPYYVQTSNNTFNDEYNSNYSALQQTTNPALISQYLNSIQTLNAQSLPVLITAYPYVLGVYSTQRWVGWQNGLTFPSGWFQAYGGRTNDALWSYLTPASASASISVVTSTVSGSVVTSTVSGSVVTSTVPGSVVTSTVSGSAVTSTITSTTSKSSVAMSWSILALVLVILLAAAALIALRRPPGDRWDR